ncbi:hypothetical protein FF100_04665 [Methylobacterium terricola]|uniref:Uncharacterized protein n=1 Tax=Methylobacterium terricola TaxID=2583531 RepID=A0A5C4LLP9_9HYPH|nr:hypothetical protein [Methylobacterium terricola]TNC14875.1 hypothetical protein FF100_04665 [Methylobacterium terricola]
MIGDDGNAPDYEQNGRELVTAAQEARSAYGETLSPADRSAFAQSLQQIIDDTGKSQTGDRAP